MVSYFHTVVPTLELHLIRYTPRTVSYVKELTSSVILLVSVPSYLGRR